VKNLENSTALRCAPVVAKGDFLGTVVDFANFANSINNSVVSDLTLNPTGDLAPIFVTACSSASSSTFIRVNANYPMPFYIGEASECTIIDSVCNVSNNENAENCSFSRSEVCGYIYNSTLFDCSTFGDEEVKLNTCTIVKCSLTSCEWLGSCAVVNCTVGGVNIIELSRIVNSDVAVNRIDAYHQPEAKTSLVLNSVVTGDALAADYCTIVNSVADITSGGNNVFWNNNGTCVADGNAQSAYDSSNVLTLGTNNEITRFVGTGYAPAIGVQDVGECPDPITDNEGYAEYVASFGDWHPQADSFLIGKGIYKSSFKTDLDGVTRPNPPTIGAYEPRPQETEQ
jgi:hypothetical protein